MIRVLAAVAALSAAWYLAAVALFFRGLHRLSRTGRPAGLQYSVIIAARNEERQIGECLRTVLDQTIGAGRFEVIVADDRSGDRTGDVVAGMMAAHANLSLVRIDETPPGMGPKKHAVMAALGKANGAVIVFTDADCRVTPAWLETLDCHFAGDTGVVQGVTSFRRTPDVAPWLFTFQSVDFLSHVVVSAAAIGAGLPINANANNLAVRRAAMEDAGWYGNKAHVVSGDDDLLLQNVRRAGRWRIAFVPDREAAVETFAQKSLAGVLNQRKKWGSVTVHYGPIQTLLLGGVFLFYCMVPVCLLAADRAPLLAAAAGGLMAVKVLGELLLMRTGCRAFGIAFRPVAVALSSVPQLLMVVYAVFAGVFGRFTWSGDSYRHATASKS